MKEKHSAGQLIATPANFPISWDDPDDARLLWRLDGHVTTAKAPLSFSVAAAVLHGFGHAFERLGLPIRVRIANFNGYTYATTNGPVPAGKKAADLIATLSSPPEEQSAAGSTNHLDVPQLAGIEPIIARFDAYWRDELLPQNRAHLAFFEDVHLPDFDLAQLKAHFELGLQQAESMGRLHALAAFPAIVAMSLFEELYCELFPEATALDALHLLQGSENQTLNGDRALWQLSRAAWATPAVRAVLARHEPEAVTAELARSDHGRDFLSQLNGYLEQYGRRLNAFAQITEPSWLEDPVTAVACLQTYLRQPDTNPETVQASLAAKRDQVIAETRQHLAGRPSAIIDRFELLLSAAQSAAGIKEDNHWILQELFYQMRRLALVIGSRMSAAGLLPTSEDVFYLSAEELLAHSMPTAAQLGERRAARAHFARIKPPAVLGTIPASIQAPAGPLFRALQKAEATNARPSKGQSMIVEGQAASAGKAQGTARVIGSLAEARRLQPGDVLVTKATTPPWTPLFEVAAAVVTDVGGVLSHCAVVAREYGIPAVVGTGRATETIQDGQLLEVNGSEGTVRILAS